MCVYLSTAVSLQTVFWEMCVRVVGLIRDDVRPLDVVYGFDPGQSRQLLIVQNITVSLRLWERDMGKRRERESKWMEIES